MSSEFIPTFQCHDEDWEYSFDIPPGTTVRVGRSSDHSDFVVPCIALARHQLSFENRNGSLIVRRMNARCGIFVNGEAVGPEGRELQAGDRLLIGDGKIYVIECLEC